MASKIRIQKAQQGYVDKPTPRQCATCGHYTSEIVEHPTRWGDTWLEEKNKRCGIGGFAVKKQAVCNLYTLGGSL